MAKSRYSFDPDAVAKAQARHAARLRAAGTETDVDPRRPDRTPSDPRADWIAGQESWLPIIGTWRRAGI